MRASTVTRLSELWTMVKSCGAHHNGGGRGTAAVAADDDEKSLYIQPQNMYMYACNV